MISNFNHIFYTSFSAAALFVGIKQFEVKHPSLLQNSRSMYAAKDAQDYHLKEFNSINIGRGFTVEVSKNDRYNVSIIGNKNGRDRYTPFVSNNTLQLKYVGREEDYKSKVDLKIIIHLPE